MANDRMTEFESCVERCVSWLIYRRRRGEEENDRSLVCPRSAQPVCICPSIRALNNVRSVYRRLDTLFGVCFDIVEYNQSGQEKRKRRGGETHCHHFFLSLSSCVFLPITIITCSSLFSAYTSLAMVVGQYISTHSKKDEDRSRRSSSLRFLLF